MEVKLFYDDTGSKSEVITDIIGNKSFADVIVRKRKLEEYYYDSIRRVYPNADWTRIHSLFEYMDILKEVELYHNEDTKIVHCFSNYLISDEKKALLSFEKLEYIHEPYRIMEGNRIVAAMFPNVDCYILFCKNVISGQKPWDAAKNIKDFFEIEGMVDIGITGNFIQCITGNFDSRYFNSLKESEYTLVKTSGNKKKIKSEYTFYHLLPEDMKFWFIMPFDYKEDTDSASYTMERLHMADLAIKWVHGSMDEDEFEELMDKYFFFFKSRHSRKCPEEEYRYISKSLYEDKVQQRIEELKNLEEYKKIEKFLDVSEQYSIDYLCSKYFSLKREIETRADYPLESVIGHGDPCFSNALYNKSTKTLKFIDPKGALTEAELWTNPYYDVAKLSHSVCGGYDFFNNALFDIRINHKLSFDLEIPFDNSDYVEIFRKKALQNGFDYLTVRVYEASLFLSMLPLHIDNPYKVMGFILNVDRILKEIEKDV